MTAIQLAQGRASVVLSARGERVLSALAQQSEANRAKAMIIATHMTDPQQAEALIVRTISLLQQADIFIADAGAYDPGPMTKLRRADFERSFAVNF